MESGDWRVQLQADSRQKIVNKILGTLKRHLPLSDQYSVQELKRIAMRFEEKIYTTATSQSNYLRKISLKMVTMETRSQNRMPDAMQANNGLNPLDPGSMASGHQAPSISDMSIDNVSSGGPKGDPSMESGDWRVQLQADSRKRIVNKILGTLKRHLPLSDQYSVQELKRIAMRFEEKIYTTATSQSDYLRTISLKMLSLETRSHNPMPDAMQANNGLNPLDPGSMASGHQAPSISDISLDNVSSGGPEGDPSMESGDWRVQLQADSRKRIVNKILGTLKRHLPLSDQYSVQELKRIAMRFEEKIYTTATSQSDYLRTISLKMVSLETRSHNPMPDAMRANNGLNPLDPGSMASGHQAPSISDMSMDNVSSAGPEGDPSMESGDWRVQLQADSRKRIVNKIMETLKRHLPFSDQETLQELKGIAMRFEEKIYTTATSQSDYLRKISLKMVTMETRSQNPMPDAMQANNGLNPLDPGMETKGLFGMAE